VDTEKREARYQTSRFPDYVQDVPGCYRFTKKSLYLSDIRSTDEQVQFLEKKCCTGAILPSPHLLKECFELSLRLLKIRFTEKFFAAKLRYCVQTPQLKRKL